MNAIVAVGADNGIGKDNDLIFSIPEDKKYFRATTLGKIIIMGRKTLESMPNGKPLPKRRNIVLTRNTDYTVEGVEVCHSVDEVKTLLGDEFDDAFVIGGAEIYKLFYDYCDTLYVTHIEENRCADKFFPDVKNDTDFKCVEISDEKEFEGIKYTFCVYKRK